MVAKRLSLKITRRQQRNYRLDVMQAWTTTKSTRREEAMMRKRVKKAKRVRLIQSPSEQRHPK